MTTTELTIARIERDAIVRVMVSLAELDLPPCEKTLGRLIAAQRRVEVAEGATPIVEPRHMYAAVEGLAS